MARPVLAAVAVLLLGWFVLAWGDEDPIWNCPVQEETASYEFGTDWWPPTTRHCEVSFKGEVSTSSWTPWDGWALVLLWVAAAAVLFARGRLLFRFAAASALWLAGLAAFFL
jgi:hypothetical protein